ELINWVEQEELKKIEEQLAIYKQQSPKLFSTTIDKLKVIFINTENIRTLDIIALMFSTFLIHSSVPLIISKLVSGRHNQEGGTLVYALWPLKKQSFKDDLIALKEEDISYEMQLMLDMMKL
ncbi:MAG TPA: hypothetical protein PKH93_14680, partial [Chitinophagales bacterium]|nr:hypothetical protein [Chitinophagales bacterium]